jgi:hypothetical protein
MFIVDWVCDQGHVFEGWYDSAPALAALRAEQDIACPRCGSIHVERKPTFGSIGRRSTDTAPTTPAVMPIEVQRFLSALIKHARANSTDVGDKFAEVALAMHRGEQEQAPIMGQSNADEEMELRQEGIEFLKIPIPPIDEN